jgi:hypothetical protein
MYAALIASPFVRERVRVRVFVAVKGSAGQSPYLNPLLFCKKERRSISANDPPVVKSSNAIAGGNGVSIW